MPQGDGKSFPELANVILLVLVIGALVYCALALIAAAKYKHPVNQVRLAVSPCPVTILRPLAGAQDNTEENLRSLFGQEYPNFEVLLSVHEATDPATVIAERVIQAFPHIPSKLIIAGISPLPNAKVWSLRALLPHAAHETIVMTDSDITLPNHCLQTIVAELNQPNVALVTCPYRAIGGPRLWSRLEALGLNTDFLAGMLTQRMLNGMDFAIGCTIATRQSELAAIGGLEALQNFLAEDFVMGQRMYAAGRTVILSQSVIDHHIGDTAFIANWKHRLRWARSTRRSRPAGYIGELFTKPVALALILLIVKPATWPLTILTFALRAAVAIATAHQILKDPAIERYWWLLPLEDIASFITWLLGFFGNTIVWRGRKLTLERDGTLRVSQ